jgi:protein tyrosine phosphatase
LSKMRPTVAASKELAERLFARLEADSPMGHTKMATLSQNQILNRWNNVLPYDTTRIKLASVNSDEDNNDYINASKVEAPFVDDKSYILTQGPLPETIGHFWSMVWQQQTSAVVMLCRLNESGICKCAHYWPSTQADDDLIRVADRGLEVRLRDLDDTDSDTLVRHNFL